MKHLLNFDTVAEYDAAKDSLEKPYIVTINENNGLQYNTDVIRVPEGQGGGGSASSVEYIDMSEASELAKDVLSRYACYVNGYIKDQNTYFVGIPFYMLCKIIQYPTDVVSAIAIDFSKVLTVKTGDTVMSMTIVESVLQELTQAELDALPRITEEEFYTL